MTINLSVPQQTELQPRITVFGVGGAGGNGVNNMIESGLEGVDFVVANTDAQALSQSLAERRIQMGATITEGLGAGSRPQVGQAAAEEALDEIFEHLTGCHMVFITAGMGGGTGTGGAPIIAKAARELGILTVGVVTKPFQFEGSRRLRVAEEGIEELQKYVDTLIVIPNQNLFRVANEKTTFADAFGMADQVLHSGVAGITDLMVRPGLINLDFADVRTVMNEMGKAMMGTGEAEGENRAIEAAEAAISNPLLDEVSMKGARGVLINITGGMDMTLYEVDEAANRVREEVDPDANIIVGSTFDSVLDGKMRVSVVATGIDAEEGVQHRPQASMPAEPVRGFRLRSAAPEADVSAEPRERVQPDVRPSAETEAMSAEDVPPASDIDPSEYEAEVIIHKPSPAAEAPREVEEPVARPATTAGSRGTVVARERGAAFIAPEAQSLQARAAVQRRKKAPSFFERITGGAKARDEEEPQQPAAPMRRMSDVSSRVEPRLGGGRSGGAAAQPAEAPQAAEPARKPSPDSVEEEQLEIPAFLRRQAN